MISWINCTIGDLGEIVTGSTPSKKKAEYYGNSGLPWIKPPDLRNQKFVNSSAEYLSHSGESKARVLPKGSILVGCIGSIGEVAIASMDLATNQQINSLIPKEKVLDSNFAYYYFIYNKEMLKSKASKAIVPILNKTNFSKIGITLPTLSEQKRIVEILDQAEEIKQLRKQADKKSNEIISSIFYKMFGDISRNTKQLPTKKLYEMCEEDKSTTRGNNSGKPYLGLEHIESNTGNILINESAAKQIKVRGTSFTFNENHILYGKLRPYLNKVALPAFKGICSTELVPLLPKDHYTREFIATFLRSEYVVNKIMTKNKGARMPRADMKYLMDFDVVDPHPNLINKFTEAYKAIKKMHSEQTSSSIKIFELYNGILAKAFDGTLTEKWREGRMKELLQEMEEQKKYLGIN